MISRKRASCVWPTKWRSDKTPQMRSQPKPHIVNRSHQRAGWHWWLPCPLTSLVRCFNPNNRKGTFPIKILTLITGITLPTLELQFLIIETRFLNLETQRLGVRKNPGTSPWRHVTRISNYRSTIPIIEISSSDKELWFPIIEHHISNNRKHN